MANLSAGQRFPEFELPDADGEAFELSERLQDGPVVLVFYRGDW